MPIAGSSTGDRRWALPEVAGFAERTGSPTSDLDGAGGGFGPEFAGWVAVAEAMERYCATDYSRDQLVTATAYDLAIVWRQRLPLPASNAKWTCSCCPAGPR
ncbi:hypothetical protein [Amycolatopsis keratiniphila]|uniref:hypothetical protein n=1 Tax=Amycolatopsis keratiniphila TaxID=129921 RepID=UPI00096F6C4B|nr:hypothetical protein [Amycolatopsis keratiniphila]